LIRSKVAGRSTKFSSRRIGMEKTTAGDVPTDVRGLGLLVS
jgi:hypothetical protein